MAVVNISQQHSLDIVYIVSKTENENIIAFASYSDFLSPPFLFNWLSW